MPSLFRELLVALRLLANGEYSVELLDEPPTWRRRAFHRDRLDPVLTERIRSGRRRVCRLEMGIDLQSLGTALADVLLPGGVRKTFLDILDEAMARNGMLRMRLDIDPKPLRPWPWELLYVQRPGDGGAADGEFLATSPFVSIVRQAAAPSATTERPVGRRIRALIVWADPKDTKLIPAGGLREVLAADRALRQALGVDVEIHFIGGEDDGSARGRATRRNIAARLEADPWEIVLFVCHGCEDGLLIEGDDDVLPAGQLRDMLRDAGVQVALFNACNSHRLAEMVAESVPITVGMQFRAPLPTAVTFWRAFFQALSGPLPIDLCVGDGRQWIESLGPHLPDWGTPVLYRGRSGSSVVRDEGRVRGRMDARAVGCSLDRISQSVGAGGIPCLTDLSAVLSKAGAGAEPWSPALCREARRLDPWHLMMLGADAGDSPPPIPRSAPRPQPAWWTALKEAPTYLIWPRGERSVSYEVEIDNFAADEPYRLPTDTNALPWPAALALSAGASVRWAVRGVTADSQRGAWTTGFFRLLGPDETDSLARAEERIAAETHGDDFTRRIALAQALIGTELYDDALRILHGEADRQGNGMRGLAARRMLGSVYKSMHDQMTKKGPWPGEGAAAVIAENDRQMRLAYCASLGHLGTYHRGACKHCNRCGLV